MRDIEISGRVLSSVEPVSFDPTVAFAACMETVIRELTLGTSALSTTRPQRLASFGVQRSHDSLVPVSRILFGCAIRFPCD